MIYSVFLMIIPRSKDFDYVIIHGAGLIDGEKVSIFRKGEAMVISETNRIANVKLTRREVARLFFGPFMPDLGCQQEDDFWRLAFPLPLFWAGPDHV